MNPTILSTGFSSFLVCLVIHILIWRTKRPRNDLGALFAIFMVLPCVAVISVVIASSSGDFWDWRLSDLAAAALLHVALSSAYIQSYPPAQAVSPSLEIMILVRRAMPRGLTQEEIAEHFDDRKLVGTRFEDLVNTRLIREDRGMFRLTSPGRKLIQGFVLYRKLLGLGLRGG